MKWIVLAVIGVLAYVAVPNLYEARQRSMQKETMAMMRAALTARRAPPPDAWGNPIRVLSAGPHTMMRSAGADGRFESTPPRGAVPRFSDDIVIADGKFVQFPEGVCMGDEPGKGPLGNCASCHPRHIAKR